VVKLSDIWFGIVIFYSIIFVFIIFICIFTPVLKLVLQIQCKLMLPKCILDSFIFQRYANFFFWMYAHAKGAFWQEVKSVQLDEAT